MNRPGEATEALAKWYLPLTRWALQEALSRGWVGGSVDKEAAESNLHHLLVAPALVKGGLDPDSVDSIMKSSGGRPPVLVEMSVRELAAADVAGLDRQGVQTSGSFTDGLGPVYVPLRGVLPLDTASVVLFRDESELKDFRARTFSDVPLEAYSLGVDPEIFDHSDPVPVASLEDLQAGSPELRIEALLAADRMVGAVIMLLKALPPQRGWFDGAVGLLRGSGGLFLADDDVVRAVCDAIPAADVRRTGDAGKALLEAATRVILSLDPADGWKSESVLGSIVSGMEDSTGMEVFANRARAVLANQAEIRSLGDDGNLIQRALMLLLLRPDPEDILASRNSSLRPGRRVVALAATLAGLHQGVTRLPNSIKNEGIDFRLATRLLTEVGNVPTMARKTKPVELRSERGMGLETKYSISSGNRLLFSCVCGGNKSLSYVRELLRRLEIESDYQEEPAALKVRFPFEGDRKQTVFICEGAPDNRGRETVRIYSPCLDMSNYKRTRGILKHKVIWNLLERNANPGTQCRFAIDAAERQLQVMVDHLVDPLDNDELESHLEHVAKTADEFEKEIGVDEF